jgi:16S rRNA (guanine(527)-N(7))-methyltransferase RsmG
MSSAKTNKQLEFLWSKFKETFNLSEKKINQLKQYNELLEHWNTKFNITAITSPRAVIKSHFWDSIILSQFHDLKKVSSLADAGSGGGFPGIPLKIAYPHLKVLLIEVNKKKQQFLSEVIRELDLKDVDVCGIDWRTFLRTTEGDIDMFVSRASLEPAELCRMFKSTCSYKDAQLVYWAAEDWEADKKVKPFVEKEHPYTISHKKRKLVFLKLKS